MKGTKRRILHVIGCLEGGGAERQLQILTNHTDSQEYDIGIVYFHRGPGHNALRREIDLIQIPRGRKWNIPALWLRVFKTVLAYRPDIVQLWLPEIVTIPAALAAKYLNARVISCVRGSMRNVRSIKRRIRDRAGYLQHLFADTMVANFNPEGEPFFLRKLFSCKKGLVISNAIVVSHDKKPSGVDSPINKADSLLIWYTGRIIPLKRLELLLDSCITLRKDGLDLSLVICGEGSPRLTRRLKQKVRQTCMQEYVHFLGYRGDWHRLARNADLFVLPSTAEGMPNVLFEAMLLGLPCIATDIPAIRKMVKHKENAWVVQPGSRSSLMEGIRQMYHSEPLRKKLARQGQRYAMGFSIKRMTQAYDTLYQQMQRAAK